MKAAIYDHYGGVEQLRLAEVDTPTPGRGQVLVEVVATSLNLSDWEVLHGSPAYSRIGGLWRPAKKILGSDIAGVVAAIGAGVTRWRVGDEVYGDNLALKGGFAEFAVAPEGALARKPAELTFEQASTIPQSGAIAAQSIARARPGERMLLNGAGGGVGVFAVQLAKAAGIALTAVDNAGKLDFLRDLGAAEVLDYRAVDFTRAGPFDLIVDLVASRSVFAYRRALAPGGRAVVVGGTTRTLLRMLTLGTLVGRLSGTRLGVMAVKQGPEHFAPVARAIAEGTVNIVIDRVYPLEHVADALTHHGEGRALGKVVVRVRAQPQTSNT